MSSTMWEIIPPEVFTCIFEFYSLPEQHLQLSVCKRWFSLMEAAILRKSLVALCSKLSTYYEFSFSLPGQYWEWTHPNTSYDGRTIFTHELKVESSFWIQRSSMTEEEFTNFQRVNDMNLVDDQFAKLQPNEGPFVIKKASTELQSMFEEQYEYLDEEGSFQQNTLTFYGSEWPDLELLLNSLNSLPKRKMIEKRIDGEYELYWLLSNDEVWSMGMQYSVTQDRYVNYNE